MSSGFSYTSDTSNEEGGLHLPMDHSSSYTFNAPSAEAVATPYELHNCLQPSQPGSSSLSRHQWSSSPSSPVQTPAGSSRYNQPAAAPRSYFDPHQGGSQTPDAAASSSPIEQDVNEASSDATISRRGSIDAKTARRKKNGQQRSPPRHRGPRGAAEPESGDEHHDEDDDEDDEDRSRARKDAPRRPDQPVQSYSHHSSRTTSTYSSSSCASETSSDRDDDDDHVRSLTRQLAETAVGVREMSKQLGRARVKSTIRSVLIITKARDNELIKLTRELALWLMLTPRNGSDRGVVVYVDSQLRTSKRFDAEGIQRDHPELLQPVSGTSSSSSKGPSSSASASSRDSSNDSNNSESEGQLRYWTADMCSRFPHLFDFVVTLGGDGTVLFCSWLFQRIVPPVLPFALGSLGFLTNFDFSDHAKVMDSAIDQGIRVNLRMRFTATVYRATLPSRNSSVVDKQRQRAIKSGRTGEIIMRNVREGGWERIEKPGGAACGTATDQPTSGAHKKDREVMCFSTRPVETFEVLNDLVVDRGPSPYVSLLEVFGDEHHMTTAQADGLCISTPTGSTAYSLSAGGSLVHPEIPAILITPICPHTLSFRPMLLPDSMELRIAVPYNSRSTAWASFDGRGRVELKQGDHIKVTASRYPFPTVCNETQSVDWFKSISRTLKWNERQRQKSFVVVEEGRSKSGEEKDAEEESKRKTKSRKQAEKGKKVGRKRTSSETGVSNQDGITDNGENVPMSKQEQRERSAVQRNAQGLADKDESLPVPNRLSGPAKVESINVDEPKPNGAAKTSEDEQEDDADEDEDEDDDDDDDEDEEDIEEAFDINDTSTVATRASSPQPMSNMSSSIGSLPAGKGSQHRHHHHHQLPRHGHKTDRSSHTHSAPGSHRASFDSLQRLAPFTAASNKSQGGSTSSQRGTISFDVPGGEGDRLHSRWPSNTSNSSKEDRVEQLNNESRASSTLNSPDRFSAAGPPDPPRALSKRHLADADFRLDGGKLLDDEQGGPGSQRQQTGASEQGKGKVKSNDSSEARTPDAMETSDLLHHAEDAIKGATSLLNKPISTAVRAGTSDSVTTDAPPSENAAEQSRSSKSTRQRAKRSTSSRRTKTSEESSSKSGAGESSGSGGTALVVYGEDSSSDSGSE